MLLYASRPASRLGAHLLLAGGCLLVLLVIITCVAVSISRKAKRAALLPALPEPPRPFPITLIDPMPGVALGTVAFESSAAGGWQHTPLPGVVGNRASGDLRITCGGVDIAGLWLPRTALRSVRVDERFATKIMPGTGLLVFGWEHEGRRYESGFRGAASGYEEVVATVRGLLETRVSEGSS